MRARFCAFSLVDLLVTAAVAVLLVSIAVPTGARVRELSKRSVCGVNLMGIGAAAKVYAASNNDQWMIPPFKRGMIDNGGIDYLAGAAVHDPPIEPGEVGYERFRETTSESPICPNCGSTAMSTTQAYWMLVRSGDVTVKQFICPSNLDDVPDPTEQVDLYYDFTGYRNVSYGYQVPFGPSDTRPREGMDHRQIIAADKGPYYLWTPSTTNPNWDVGQNGPITLDDWPKAWRPFNSSNHGGQGNGEGENALYGDGHASFVRIPAVGVDDDNIYTVIDGQGWGVVPYNRIHGDTPHQSPDVNPYPGQNALGVGAGKYATTDSLIYP
ncbi:MAG: hypothetical protein V1790_01395 [Planctomycetota bacterium]